MILQENVIVFFKFARFFPFFAKFLKKKSKKIRFFFKNHLTYPPRWYNKTLFSSRRFWNEKVF